MSFAAVLERLSKLENPYPGLRPFEAEEAHLFFGRDQQVLDLLDRLRHSRFVAVMGLSGSGKSSLVRAGLIPALFEGRLLEPGLRWRVAVVRPAGAPYDSLADALGCNAEDLRSSSHGLIDFARGQLSPGEGIFVLLDQFEELFRYKDRSASAATDPADRAAAASEAAAFVDLLLASTRSPLPIYVVITMRTDYLGDCAEFPELPDALIESQYLVPRLTREQRRQAIEGPLGRVRISSALLEQILNDAGDEPDQLPILQHVLMRTWSRWRESSGNERPIEMEQYEAAGGFAGALNQHADELMDSPDIRAEPKFVEIIFRRLTALGRGNRERRDPAIVSELWDLCSARSDERRQRVNEIIDAFRHGEATFLTPRKGELTPDTYVDIAHESLIRNWKLLATKWLPEEEKQAKILHELLDRARGCRAGTKEVLFGLDLSGALEWDSQRNRSVKWAEHYAGPGAIEEVEAFLANSLAASREKFDEAERRKRDQIEAERRAARRTKILSYVLTALLLVGIGFGFVAWRATKLAESRELAATAEALVSSGRSGEALETAIHAFSIEKTSESREAIARAFPQELTRLEGHSDAIPSVEFSPDGKRVVTASRDGTARVWNAATGQVIAKLEGHSDAVTSAVFSPDGQRVVTASRDETAQVWNAATGQAIAKLTGHSDAVTSAVFSPDGQRVVTASRDGTARVWNATTGQVIAKLEGHSDAVTSAVFSPNGQRVVTASDDHTARVWSAATGKLNAELLGHSDGVTNVAFSPDGRWVVTASDDHTARVWNVDTGQVIAKLEGHSGAVSNAIFSPNGQRVVTASADHTARVWNATTGWVVAILDCHSEVSGVSFSPDGQWVATANGDRTARVWNAVSGQILAKFEGHADAVLDAAFSPDGKRVVTAGTDHRALIWNIAAAGHVTAKLEGHRGPVETAEFSRDGRRVVTASYDGTAWVWNATTGQVIAKLEGHSGKVYSAVFSRDGQRVVTASDDQTARVWNATTGQVIAKLEGHSGPVKTAAFSPDGQRVLTASDDQTARVWNAATGQVVAKLEGHTNRVRTAAFSPDGKRVVTASRDGTARVWNAATGQLMVKLESHSGPFESAAFSPDGKLVVTSDGLNTRVWSAATGRVIAELGGHFPRFSPDGWRVVTAGFAGSLWVWNAATGQMVATLERHASFIQSASFSPDGQWVVTASDDETARVWNTASGQVIAKLEDHSGAVWSAAFSPDGERVVTASRDNTALIYRIVTLDDIVHMLASK